MAEKENCMSLSFRRSMPGKDRKRVKGTVFSFLQFLAGLEVMHQKAPLHCNLLQMFVSCWKFLVLHTPNRSLDKETLTSTATMSTVHVASQQTRLLTSLLFAHFRHILHRLPIGHSRVMQTRNHQNGRIFHILTNIVHW